MTSSIQPHQACHVARTHTAKCRWSATAQRQASAQYGRYADPAACVREAAAAAGCGSGCANG
eukprot:11513948-Alexandrium_andersonii.AAC.1